MSLAAIALATSVVPRHCRERLPAEAGTPFCVIGYATEWGSRVRGNDGNYVCEDDGNFVSGDVGNTVCGDVGHRVSKVGK
jgi:hypothetical protein